jgi:hypothetical protein
MDVQLVFFLAWAFLAFTFVLATIVFAVWERRKYSNAETARAGSLVPEIYIVQEDFEEVLERGYSR